MSKPLVEYTQVIPHPFVYIIQQYKFNNAIVLGKIFHAFKTFYSS